METGIAQLEYQNLLGLGLPEMPRQLAGNGVVEGAATDDVAMSLRRKPGSGVMWPTIFLFGGGNPPTHTHTGRLAALFAILQWQSGFS